jgi:hypothetical protein
MGRTWLRGSGRIERMALLLKALGALQGSSPETAFTSRTSSTKPPILRNCAKWYPTPSGVAPDARDRRRGNGNLIQFVFREVSHENWPDFAGLFESRGGPKSCWCMVWRSTATEAKQRMPQAAGLRCNPGLRPACRSALSAIVTAPPSPGVRSRLGTPTAISGDLMMSKRLNKSGRWRASSSSESIAATGSRKSCFWQPSIMLRAMARP